MIDIPESYREKALSIWGQKEGGDWLERLPSVVAGFEERWSVTVGPPFPELSYQYVAPAVRADGEEVVLKVGIPHRELSTEIEALRLYGGRGIVRLLEGDPEGGGMLLERLRPGAMLTSVSDEEATVIAARVMREYWRPPPPEHTLLTIPEWTEDLFKYREQFGSTGPLPAALVDRALSLYEELMASSGPPVLLHGDLHHTNVLSAERESWLAIDPKGVIGDPAFDVAQFLINWVTEAPDPKARQERRIAVFAEELGFSRERVRDWGFVKAMLSVCWSVEEEGFSLWDEALAIAEMLADIKV